MKQEKMGTWTVNHYGADRFCLEETDGPGHASLVMAPSTGKPAVFDFIAEAQDAADAHNRGL